MDNLIATTIGAYQRSTQSNAQAPGRILHTLLMALSLVLDSVTQSYADFLSGRISDKEKLILSPFFNATSNLFQIPWDTCSSANETLCNSSSYYTTGIDYYINSIWASWLNLVQFPLISLVILPMISVFLVYLIGAFIPYFLEYKLPNSAIFQFLKRYKIQNRSNSEDKMMNAAKVVLTHYLFVLPTFLLSFPMLRVMGFEMLFPLPPWYVMVLQVLFCMILEDTMHYWLHRWLHTEFMYKNVHYFHHEFSTPASIGASYAHPLEIVILGLCTFSGLFILRPHYLVFVTWVTLRQMTALETHCGFDFPYSIKTLFPYWGGAEFHDFHHRTYNGAYSSNFIWWDIICGTDKGFCLSKKRKEKRNTAKEK